MQKLPGSVAIPRISDPNPKARAVPGNPGNPLSGFLPPPLSPQWTDGHPRPPSATLGHPPATLQPPSRVADRSLANSRFPEEIVHSAGVGHPCHPCHRRDHAFPHSDQISASHCTLCATVQIVSGPRDSKKSGRSPFILGHSRRRQAPHLSGPPPIGGRGGFVQRPRRSISFFCCQRSNVRRPSWRGRRRE